MQPIVQRVTHLALVLVLCGFAAACGNGSDDTGTSNSANTAQEATAATGDAQPLPHVDGTLTVDARTIEVHAKGAAAVTGFRLGRDVATAQAKAMAASGEQVRVFLPRTHCGQARVPIGRQP